MKKRRNQSQKPPRVVIDFVPRGHIYDRWRDVFVLRSRYVPPKEELARLERTR